MRQARSPASDPSEPDDQTLVAGIATGDRQALERLYDRYARLVYGLALRMLGNSELAEDIVQETFWRVWRRSNTFRSSRGQVSTWIFGIAHNLSIDELRRQRARPNQVYGTDATSILRELTDNQIDVVDAALEQEQNRQLEQALQQIPSEQRTAIELAYLAGLSQREIAEQLQSPLGTIKTRIRLGLQKLREILTAQHIRVDDTTDEQH